MPKLGNGTHYLWFYCDVCQRRVVDMEVHCATQEHQRNSRRLAKMELPAGFNYISKGTITCPTCGGRLFYDLDDKEWRCVNCAHPAIEKSLAKPVPPRDSSYGPRLHKKAVTRPVLTPLASFRH